MFAVADLAFYMFGAVLLISALRVITTRNPVHSALFLILTFFTAAALFVLLHAEFLAAILVMVYMGAVAVLFLFVVMMLDVDFAELRRGALNHMPIGVAVGGVILAEFVVAALSHHAEAPASLEGTGEGGVPNTLAIGRILYTQYLYPFEIASLILLVAMIGAIVLTLRERKDARRQDIPEQLARTRDQAVTLKKVKSGEGA